MKKKFLIIIISVLAVLLLISCADLFQDKVSYRGSEGSLDTLFVSSGGISKLSVPAQFFLANNYSSSDIRMTWNEVPGAAFYMIERAVSVPVISGGGYVWEEPDEGDYDVLERFVYNTFFTDNILRNPAFDSPEYSNKYYYRISAYNPARGYEESDHTVPQSGMLFRAPERVQASGGISVEYVDISWENSDDAVSYEVWRSELPNGTSASLLGTVHTNRFRNSVSMQEQGRDFYYMIIAINMFGNKSLQTRPAYGYARMFGAPDVPANLRLQHDSGRGHSTNEIKIEWDASDDPDAYYAVFRYSSIDSSLTRLTERTENTSWTDSMGLRPGIYYYYKVQAIVDDVSSGRALKSEFSSTDPEGFVLSPPDTVTAAKNDEGTVTVRWTPAMGSELERLQYTYNVYADTRIDGSFSTRVAGDVSHNTDGQGFISVELERAETFFRVTTIKGDVESSRSAVVSPATNAAVIVNASQHVFISASTPANSNGVFPVMITWRKPDNDEPAFYNVQRSTRSGTGFSRVNEVPLGANGPFSDNYFFDEATGIYTYIDRNESARPGRKFHYRVLSLNQLEQGNFPSSERIGWGALTHQQYLIEYARTMNGALKKLTLMHRPGSTDKLGSETRNGTISGTIFYDAAISGLGARIIIRLTNYADFYIDNDSTNGVYFILNGNSNTSANMNSNGTMDGTMTVTGMYPGRIFYDWIEIRGGAAGGGTYGVEPEGFQRLELPYTMMP